MCLDNPLNGTKNILTDWSINIMVRVFANSLRDWVSISGWVIAKTQKIVLDAFLLNMQHHKVWIKGNWSNPKKEVAPSPTPWWSSY